MNVVPLAPGTLVGTWHLVSWTIGFADGRPSREPFGSSPEGLLAYTPDGFVHVSIASVGRELLGTDNVRRASVERQLAALQTYFTYAGPYEVDGDTIIHHIALSVQPDLVGTEQRRHAVLSDGELVLSAEYLPPGSEVERHHRLVWRR